MGRPIQDDFSGELLNAEVDQVYTLSVSKYQENEHGQRKLMRLSFDIGHNSLAQLILQPFEGKKILQNWEVYEPPTEEALAKNPKAKGKFVRVRK